MIFNIFLFLITISLIFIYLRSRDTSNESKDLTKNIRYKPTLTLKLAPPLLVIFAIFLSIFIWFIANLRVNQGGPDMIKGGHKTLKIASENYAHELEQIIQFTKTTNRILELNNTTDVNNLYIGEKGLSLQLLNNLNTFSSNELIKLKNLKSGEQIILPRKNNIIFASLLSNGLYALYLLPQASLDAIQKRILPYETSHITLEENQTPNPDESLDHLYPKITDKISNNYPPIKGSHIMGQYKIESTIDYLEIMQPGHKRGKISITSIRYVIVVVDLIALLGLYTLYRLRVTSKKLFEMVSLDNLTRLPNRRTFNNLIEEFAHENRKNSFLGLLFIDLDNFKGVNDTMGHAAGDLLLQQVALRLNNSIRSSDVAFRLGGDEFTILLPNLENSSQATAVASRIVESLGKKFNLGGTSVATKASVGLALMPSQAVTVEDLIKCSDTAMYHAKESGKGCYAVYEPSMVSKSIQADHCVA